MENEKMDTNEPNTPQSEPCAGSSSPASGSAPAGQKKWKTGVFIAVMVFAGGVAANSVLTNNEQNRAVSPCGRLDAADATCAVQQGGGAWLTCAKTAGCPSAQVQGCTKADGSTEKAGSPADAQQNKSPAACPEGAAPGCCPEPIPN